MSRYTRIELLVYVSFWLLITSFAVVSSWNLEQVHTLQAARHIFGQVLLVLLPLLVLFIVHNFLLAPLLVYKGKKLCYTVLTFVMMVLFILTQIMAYKSPERAFVTEQFHPFTPGSAMSLIAFLVLCANLGVKYVIYAIESRDKIQSLERENLDRQLQYLRYQINPHFMMNTLNNIHALVDIDPKVAKKTILELSRLLRYVLYEGSRPTIPLVKEIEFMQELMSLIRIRYADDLKVTMQVPENCEGAEVPPLLFATFVENAFKHGSCFEEDSFIDIQFYVESGRVCFRCINSRHKEDIVDEANGIGLENVRKRLSLLYGPAYTLDISDGEKTYDVFVSFPLAVNLDNIKNFVR